MTTAKLPKSIAVNAPPFGRLDYVSKPSPVTSLRAARYVFTRGEAVTFATMTGLRIQRIPPGGGPAAAVNTEGHWDTLPADAEYWMFVYASAVPYGHIYYEETAK